jgi:endo-1,3(4)-beta-glucanase
MGFVTGIYKNCTPFIQSSVFFRDLISVGTLNDGAMSKYRIILEDGKTWLLYLTPHGGQGMEPLKKTNNTCIQGRGGYFGTIQVAKLPVGCSEELFDRSAGAYATSATISGSAEGNKGTYTFSWNKSGLPKPLLMYVKICLHGGFSITYFPNRFALPHHVNSFDPSTAQAVSPIHLQTTTKGMATGVTADEWHMNEPLPIDMGFAPWVSGRGTLNKLSPAAIAAVVNAAKSEVEQDVNSQCCLSSMYFSGKGLAKFAMMAFTLNDLAHQPEMAKGLLNKLKGAFAVFVENRQQNPLV